jgi:hypothetical protein
MHHKACLWRQTTASFHVRCHFPHPRPGSQPKGCACEFPDEPPSRGTLRAKKNDVMTQIIVEAPPQARPTPILAIREVASAGAAKMFGEPLRDPRTEKRLAVGSRALSCKRWPERPTTRLLASSDRNKEEDCPDLSLPCSLLQHGVMGPVPDRRLFYCVARPRTIASPLLLLFIAIVLLPSPFIVFIVAHRVMHH